MPGQDHSLELRKAVVDRLRGYGALTALVPSASIYSEQPKAVPSWPFIRYGTPIFGAFEATCWEGSEGEATIHVFASDDGAGKHLKITKQVVNALRDLVLPDPGLHLVDWEWADTTVLGTEDAGAYHAAVRFRFGTAEAAL